MASETVTIFSAASSGISIANSSSNAMTSSTVSRLSAPRSSMNLAPSVTLASSTPRCSTTIFFDALGDVAHVPSSAVLRWFAFELRESGQMSPDPPSSRSPVLVEQSCFDRCAGALGLGVGKRAVGNTPVRSGLAPLRSREKRQMAYAPWIRRGAKPLRNGRAVPMRHAPCASGAPCGRRIAVRRVPSGPVPPPMVLLFIRSSGRPSTLRPAVATAPRPPIWRTPGFGP